MVASPNPYAPLLDVIPVERREAAVLGGTTAYWVYGPHDADTTVIAVHGFRGEHHGLEPVVAHLPDVRILCGTVGEGLGHATRSSVVARRLLEAGQRGEDGRVGPGAPDLRAQLPEGLEVVTIAGMIERQGFVYP